MVWRLPTQCVGFDGVGYEWVDGFARYKWLLLKYCVPDLVVIIIWAFF